MPSVGELAAAFHTHYALSGGDRRDRLAAADWVWAWEALRQSAEQPDDGLAALVDALLDVSDPDPVAYRAYVDAAVLEDSVGTGSVTWGLIVAKRCRSSATWRGGRGGRCARGLRTMSTLINALSSNVPAELTGLITLGRTLKRRACDVLAYFTRPGTSNGPTEAINGRLEHLRGSALGFRNLTN